MRKLFRRLHYLLNRPRLERELADEMAAHREMLSEDRRAAFGRDIAIREQARDVWAWVWLDRLWQDLVYAVRMFRNAPGFTLGAIAVLALGVGVNLGVMHVFDALLLHRINVEGADSIYQFEARSKQGVTHLFHPATVAFYRAHCTQCLYIVSEHISFDAIVDSETDQRANYVSGNYFSALRILPAWGRLLDERDAQPGATPVAVLGYEYWRDRWGGDPHAVGRVVRIDGKPVQIVGVAPYDFGGLSPLTTSVWLSASQDSGAGGAVMYARPHPGVSEAVVEQQLTALSRQLDPARSDRIAGERLPGTGVMPKRMGVAIYLFFALFFLVLLSACANLGNMLLARGMARQREFDIRIALGAGRRRVIRQLLTENLLLALMGAAAGLAFGYVSARVMLGQLDAPPDIRIRLDWQMVAATGALALLSALAFGLPPALQIAGAKHKSGRRRQTLVGVQVAVSTLLLICTGVLARTAIKSAALELSFDYANMVVVHPAFYGQHQTPSIARQKADELATRLAQAPGVDAVTTAGIPPLGQRYLLDSVSGMPPVYMNYVAPNYFAAMRIPVVRGRSFNKGEENVAIVSESAARAAWPNEDPIGKVWNVEKAQRTIVGLVKDSGASRIVDDESVEAYIPIEAARADSVAMIVHAKGDVAQLVRAIPLVSAAAGERLSAIGMKTSREKIMDGQRKFTTLIGALGAVAAVLAAAGMFAMVAFTVAQRTKEIGIRMAIGARALDVLRAVFSQNLAPVALGMAVGTALGIAVGKLFGSMVEARINTLDPLGFAMGLAAFSAIAVLATWSPAVKALRIDPSNTLRCE
jgi:predicted permease